MASTLLSSATPITQQGAGYAKHFVLFWHVNYVSASFFLLFGIVDATTQKMCILLLLLLLCFCLI